jgi:hypothetical protein
MRLVVGRSFARGALLGSAFLVCGCSIGSWRTDMFIAKTPQGQEVLTATCLRWQSPQECQAMAPVTITRDPADEEFWMFDLQRKGGTGGGTPFVNPGGTGAAAAGLAVALLGSASQRIPVLGSQEQCEARRAQFDTWGAWLTRACEGPLYFRRDKPN